MTTTTDKAADTKSAASKKTDDKPETPDLGTATATAVLELARLGRLTPETTAVLAEAVDPKPESDQEADS